MPNWGRRNNYCAIACTVYLHQFRGQLQTGFCRRCLALASGFRLYRTTRPRAARPKSPQITPRRSLEPLRHESQPQTVPTLNDLRSSLPVGSIQHHDWPGTMYSGWLWARQVRKNAGSNLWPLSDTTYSPLALVVPWTLSGTTAACATAGWRSSTASISRGSIRKPRILSCWSAAKELRLPVGTPPRQVPR